MRDRRSARLLSREETRREALECGRHSGIPRCCIAFYVTAWRWAQHQRWMDAYAYHRWRDFDHGGYVQCPLCKVLRRSLRLPLAECHCWFGGAPKQKRRWRIAA